MDKISATTATSSAHQSPNVEKVNRSDPHDDTHAQAIKRAEEAESTKRVIDSRPSQAHLKFQQSLYATQGASDGNNS